MIEVYQNVFGISWLLTFIHPIYLDFYEYVAPQEETCQQTKGCPDRCRSKVSSNVCWQYWTRVWRLNGYGTNLFFITKLLCIANILITIEFLAAINSFLFQLSLFLFHRLTERSRTDKKPPRRPLPLLQEPPPALLSLKCRKALLLIPEVDQDVKHLVTLNLKIFFVDCLTLYDCL